MSDFYDDELRGTLLRASGGDCDTEDAFGEVYRRVRRARRRRMDVVCALLVIAMFVSLGVAARSARHAASDGPASTDTAVATLPSSTTTATTVAPAIVAPAPPADGAAVSPSTPGVSPASAAPPASDSTADTASGNESAAAVAPSSSSSGSSSSSDRSAARTSPPKTPQTFTVTGGQVTVTTANGVLTLVSVDASAGYTAGPPWTGADRIQVGFHSQSGDSWIRVDLVNGDAQATVGSSADHTGTHRSIPSTTTAPRPPTSEASRPALSYPSGRTGSTGPTDSRPGYGRR